MAPCEKISSESLRAAVEAAPDDTALRLHLAELLLHAGESDEALRELGQVLQRDPTSERALELIASARSDALDASEPDAAADEAGASEDDWQHFERELEGVVPPMFVEGADEGAGSAADGWPVERVSVSLADVGGLADVKERLEVGFLAPLRNPELSKLYRKTLRGGLLMYGPPGCGKTYIARALAGELGAGFLHVAINDVLDMYIGTSERNLHGLFAAARRNVPCVVFMDEIDALGRRRSQLQDYAGLRTTVNQLLLELDGAEESNEGVFVLAATNHPWDVDPALRRPGRFDRMVLVTPPDRDAREVIFRANLAERPIASIALGTLAARSEGLSGADIAHVCETAAEKAMIDSVRRGEPRLIEMADLEAALQEVKPSTGAWFAAVRNVIEFANTSGEYDELREYMRAHRLL